MINEALLNPHSIVVVGGSNNTAKPGGKVIKNIRESSYCGDLMVVNPKEDTVQGLQCFRDIKDLPAVDLAILSIPSQFTLPAIRVLAREKGTRAFVVLSAGYSEMGPEGRKLEEEIVEEVNRVQGALIGPNCIGLITPRYNATFTEPTPRLDPEGCDFVSGSGATAVFIIESALPKGLGFASIYSVGNSAQIGVEEVLAHWDETFDPDQSPRIKLLYIENIDRPALLLQHARSLIRKGCRIAAIKAGSSQAGSRAASSHTGAMASSDRAVSALFDKAGIVRCYSREELATVAGVLKHPPLQGRNIAVITHAGGPGVMLTDVLSHQGMAVPRISSPARDQLLESLYPGSSVENPIDFLATGTARQLDTIIDFTENKFDEIDGMVIIFGTPGLVKVHDVYDVIDRRMKTGSKPIYPVLPSLQTAREEIEQFLSRGRINFPDEVILGQALARVFHTPAPQTEDPLPALDSDQIQSVVNRHKDGYLPPESVSEILDLADIPRVPEVVITRIEEIDSATDKLGFPLVMKVIGPVHKTDVKGVVLNVTETRIAKKTFDRLMTIPGARGALIQPVVRGTELFMGAKYEEKFGHLVLFGLGGVLVEVFHDVAAGLAPLDPGTIRRMLKSLKGYSLLQGIRGNRGVDEEKFSQLVYRLCALLKAAPQIREMDINPLIGEGTTIQAVDARIRIKI